MQKNRTTVRTAGVAFMLVQRAEASGVRTGPFRVIRGGSLLPTDFSPTPSAPSLSIQTTRTWYTRALASQTPRQTLLPSSASIAVWTTETHGDGCPQRSLSLARAVR